MKILEVVEGAKRTGAASAALLSARALAARGNPVTWLVEPGSAMAGAGREAGFRVLEDLAPSALGLRRSARRIRELAADAEVVHVHRSRSHLAALLALGLSGRAPPLARTCHAGRAGQTGPWARWLVARCEALVVRSADLAFDLRGPAASGGARLGVIPGGVDEKVFHPGIGGSAVRAKLDLGGATVVGTVAHLKPGRRLLKFCLAAERLCKKAAFEKLRFLIIGRGKLRKSLTPWIEKAKLASRVKIFDPGEEFPAAVAALDVGVLLVPGSDGSARAALEMAALGKPMVLGRVGALADLAGPEGEAARPVGPDSIEEIAAAVGELALDGELRERLGRAARARFQERHTLARLGEHYEKLFASVTRPAP